jgi:hypothetical protein
MVNNGKAFAIPLIEDEGLVSNWKKVMLSGLVGIPFPSHYQIFKHNQACISLLLLPDNTISMRLVSFPLNSARISFLFILSLLHLQPFFSIQIC